MLNPLQWRRDRAEMRAVVGFYAQFIRSGDLCFDVGAHQGLRSDAFLRLGAKVVAVEPQPKLAQRLASRYRCHNGRVVVLAQGLDEREGQTTIHLCNYSTCASMNREWIDSVKDWDRLQGRVWQETATVPVTTLDRLIERYGIPSFCKIDVEGFEWPVIKGLSLPLPALSLEYNPRYLGVVEKCIEHLSSLGDYRFNYSEGDSMTLGSPEWVSARAMKAQLRETLGNRDVYGDIYARLGRD